MMVNRDERSSQQESCKAGDGMAGDGQEGVERRLLRLCLAMATLRSHALLVLSELLSNNLDVYL
jgi:hypothetical protein